MGPLFSGAVAFTGLAVIVTAAFAVLCWFRKPWQALVLALSFAVGAVAGIGVAAVAAMPVVSQTMESSASVVVYLGSLCLAGLVSGGLALRVASSVLTRRSSRRPSAAAELQRSDSKGLYQ